jgi:hypothetical protein
MSDQKKLHLIARVLLNGIVPAGWDPYINPSDYADIQGAIAKSENRALIDFLRPTIKQRRALEMDEENDESARRVYIDKVAEYCSSNGALGGKMINKKNGDYLTEAELIDRVAGMDLQDLRHSLHFVDSLIREQSKKMVFKETPPGTPPPTIDPKDGRIFDLLKKHLAIIQEEIERRRSN